MQVVYKQVLEMEDTQKLQVPKGAQFRSVALQHNKLCIWYECDTERPNDFRKVAIYGTGHEMNTDVDHTFIGTVLMHEGSLVLHIYEIGF